jgi:flagellar biosynthetic protein FliP
MKPLLAILAALFLITSAAWGAEAASGPAVGGMLLPDLQHPGTAGAAMQWLVLVTVLSVAPAVAVMVTSFTRIIVVLGLLRQALASPQLPPNQVLFGLALFMTAVVMAPVYRDVHRDSISPYLAGKSDLPAAWAAGEKHLRAFMIRQVDAAGNAEEVYPFLDAELAKRKDLAWGDVPTLSLMPAFVISELKTAFMIGFRIYLPFVIIDMLVASVLMSMGMLMLPPVLISMPFKLLLFVLADGWHLVVGTLMKSFG